MNYLLKAVHRRELEGFLRQSGLFDLLLSNKVQCDICGSKININNLGAIGKEEGKIIFLCDSHHWEKASVDSDSGRDKEEQ